MDANVALIVGALSSAMAKLAEPLVKDSYEALKSLIKSKFGRNSDVEKTLDRFENNPTTWDAPLAEILVEAGVGNDEQILKLAQSLSSLTKQNSEANVIQAKQEGNNNTQVNTAQNTGTVIGTQNNSKVDMD